MVFACLAYIVAKVFSCELVMSAAEEKPIEGAPDLACLADVVSAVLVTVRDKEEQVRLALAAMLSGGHLLI